MKKGCETSGILQVRNRLIEIPSYKYVIFQEKGRIVPQVWLEAIGRLLSPLAQVTQAQKGQGFGVGLSLREERAGLPKEQSIKPHRIVPRKGRALGWDYHQEKTGQGYLRSRASSHTELFSCLEN